MVMAPSAKYERILAKRPNPPGQHGPKARRNKIGEYGSRLFEKQKLRYFYSISERQMRRYFAEAVRRTGPTGTNLLQLLERRLDAVVYRLGLAPTIWAARQLVGHGHVLVDGARVNIPSYQVKPGQNIALSEKIRKSAQIAEWSGRVGTPPPYLERGADVLSGKMTRVPERDEIPIPIDDRLIIEFYSR